MLEGYGFDVLAFVTRKKLPIRSVCVKKHCAVTKFNAQAAHTSDFQAPYSLGEGLEWTLKYQFLHPNRTVSLLYRNNEMEPKNAIKIFENRQVRSVWDSEQEK
jgi:hypothetical protein